jgi:hypothetical protein
MLVGNITKTCPGEIEEVVNLVVVGAMGNFIAQARRPSP